MYNNDNQRTTAGNLGGFVYDGNGNPTQYNSATADNFAFDPENRLTTVASPAFYATYGTDGLRAIKTAGGTTLYFLYDETGSSQTPLIEETFVGGTAKVVTAYGFGADGRRALYTPATLTAGTQRTAFAPV